MWIVVLLIGLCIGSFLNVCICRIAKEESIIYPRSYCRSCGYSLKARDLIPVLSYMFLKGRCRSCKDKISIKYPLVEILNSLLYTMLFLKFEFTIIFIKYCVITSVLIVIGMVDYETKFVYRSTINFGVITSIIFIVLEGVFLKESIANYIIGGVLGLFIILSMVLITRGMGEGDIEIAVICGLYLGWKGLLVNLFLSFTLGGIFGVCLLLLGNKKRKSQIAFGPFLALGMIITIFFDTHLINGYINYLNLIVN